MRFGIAAAAAASAAMLMDVSLLERARNCLSKRPFDKFKRLQDVPCALLMTLNNFVVLILGC